MPDNKTIVQNIYAAFARGDIPAGLSALSPDATWTEAAGFPYAGTYTGADEILERVFMRLGTEWEGFAAVPQEFIAEGDTVVVLGEYSGTYKATGKSFRAPFVHVFKLENGSIKSFVQHTDTALVQQAL